MKCPECGSDRYTSIESDGRLLCKGCGYHALPPGWQANEPISSIKTKLAGVDPRFGKFIGDGVAKIGDKEFPLHDMRIVNYNPDGDPAESYDVNVKPKTMDGEE